MALAESYKRWVVASALIFALGSASGEDRIIERMRICSTEADGAKRLSCYDFQIGRAKSSTEIGMTGEFLLNEQKRAGMTAAPPADMVSKVAAIAGLRYGKFAVTLDNGQVWAQEEIPDFTLQVGDVITIRRGVLGALWLVSPSGHAQVRVRRTK